MSNESLKNISNMQVERYSNRYREMGYNVRTLGWGSAEQQEYRFLQTLDLDFEDKSVVDIGCGFGDFYKLMKEEGIGLSQYTGWDINPDLVGEANKRYAKDPKANFAVKNISEEKDGQPVADIGIMLGLLNLNFKEEYDNYAYSRLFIENALKYVKETLIVDFISAVRTPDYPQEDFIFYHDPVKMLELSFELSPKVVLKHDYAPIPQREFMLFITK